MINVMIMPNNKPKPPKSKRTNLMESRPYLELICLISGGTPSQKGTLEDIRRFALTSVRNLLLRSGVHDAHVRIPVTYEERLLIGLLARGNTYVDSTQIVSRLSDSINPADLTSEVSLASKESLGEKIKELFQK